MTALLSFAHIVLKPALSKPMSRPPAPANKLIAVNSLTLQTLLLYFVFSAATPIIDRAVTRYYSTRVIFFKEKKFEIFEKLLPFLTECHLMFLLQ